MAREGWGNIFNWKWSELILLPKNPLKCLQLLISNYITNEKLNLYSFFCPNETFSSCISKAILYKSIMWKCEQKTLYRMQASYLHDWGKMNMNFQEKVAL